MESRLGHLAKPLNPIGVQQFRDGGVNAGVSGALGYPIYGMTPEQKRTKQLEKALKRYNERHSQGQK